MLRTQSHHGLMASLLTLALLFCATQALADEPAGSVKTAAGEVMVIRGGGAPTALKSGDKIFEKDVLTTGPGASLGLVLRDNSTLSLGPGSKLVVERFLFAPEKNNLSALINLKKGSMACNTGEMTRLSPGGMQFLAARYTIGIRGTRFAVNIEGEPEAETEAEGGR